MYDKVHSTGCTLDLSSPMESALQRSCTVSTLETPLSLLKILGPYSQLPKGVRWSLPVHACRAKIMQTSLLTLHCCIRTG